jgi:GcrA cell cycle regulator
MFPFTQSDLWEQPGIIDRLRELFARGLSTRQIAEALGHEHRRLITRNAVIGKLHRLHLKRPAAAKPMPRPRVRRIRPPNPPKPPAPVFQQQQQLQPVTWMSEGHRLCQWPHGTPGHPDFGFCGMRALPDKPYCRQHCDLAYKPESTR